MMNCDQEEEQTVLAQDIENLLSPGIVGEWEFALSEPDQAVEYVRMKVCGGCGGDHVRLFFESLEEREGDQVPERSWIMEMAKDNEGDLMVRVHVYDEGIQVAGCFVRPASAGSFMRNYSEVIAKAVLPLRAVAKSVPTGAVVH